MSLPSSSVPSNTVLHSVTHHHCTEVENRLEMMQRQLHRWDLATVFLLSWHPLLFIHLPWAAFVVLFFSKIGEAHVNRHGGHNAVASEADGAGSTGLQLCDVPYRSIFKSTQTRPDTGPFCRPFGDRNASHSLWGISQTFKLQSLIFIESHMSL